MTKKKRDIWKFKGIIPESSRPDICQPCPDCAHAMIYYETRNEGGEAIEGCHLCTRCRMKLPIRESLPLPDDTTINEFERSFNKWNYGVKI